MKKIGIITIVDYNNYGNRLQNYALQETLKKLDLDVVSIVNKTELSKISRLKYILNYPPKEILIRVFNKLYKRNHLIQVGQHNAYRRKKFINFTSNYIKETQYFISELSMPKDKLTTFDYFIAGSDQIWNPNFRHGSSIDFLTFAPKEKRVSYAASFGIDEIPIKYKGNYKKWLSEMSYVSVREEAGAKIVKNLTGRDVPVLADPTLILPKEQWIEVSKKANNRPDTPYLLTYFLGGPSKETRKKLDKLAREKNMTIINLGDITERETYETGPSEFLDYINNASAFFTDSFHGVVFSIIFQTPFVVYERQSSGPSMYSRIETILDNFDMRDREAEGFDQDIFSMDFSGTYEVLEREYEKSINYLKEALRIEE